MIEENVPYSEETEQIVIGSVFIEPTLIKEVETTIKPQSFFIPFHREVWQAIMYLHYQNSVVDYTTVIDRLEYKYKKDGKDKNKIDVDYILSLSDSVPTTTNFMHYAEMLQDIAQKRDLYEVAKYIVENDIKGVSTQNLVKVVNQALENVSVTSNVDLVATKKYASEWLEDFLKPISQDKISFGFQLLDNHILLERSNLGIIGARPGVGKSAYALNLAKNFCLQGMSVLFVSLEMSSKEVMNRMIANISGVEHDMIQRKIPLDAQQQKAIDKAVKKVEEFNLSIYDRGSLTADHLYNMAKKLNKQGKMDVLIVDYLQLMDGGKRSNGNDVQDISYISRRLKQLAQELYLPVIALSQLSRAGVQQNGKVREPQLSDLRQSGSIEQDANFVLMLHSEDVDDKFPDRKFITMYIRKNRSGSLGQIKMQYYGDTVHFEEMQWNNDTGQFDKVIQKNWEDEVNIVIEDDDLPF